MTASNKQTAIIFGAGNAGIAAMQNITEQYEVLALCDNDPQKAGTYVDDIPIISPNQLDNYTYDKILIASEFFEKIEQQLKVIGIAESKIQVLAATDIKSVHFGSNQQIHNLAVSILLLVCKTLQQANIHYYVDAGTLLGIYRDGALIPWDDDLDVAISSKEWLQTQQAITDILPELQKLTHCPWVLKVHYAGQDFGAVKKGDVRSLKLQPDVANSNLPLMDFFVKYVAGDVMDYTLSSRGIRMPSEHILQLANMEFAGEIINIPGNVELYLERHYGDWRTPKKDWDLSELKNATVY